MSPRVAKSERNPRPLTKAEWEKVHAACIRAEIDPDPSQISLLDDASATPESQPGHGDRCNADAR